MPEGLKTLTLAETFAQVAAETDPARSVDGEAGKPPVGTDAVDLAENVPVEPSEQPAASEGASLDAADQELVDQLLNSTEITQDGSDPEAGQPAPGSDEFLNLPVEVKTPEGPQTVTIRELQDGYLRQADYTRKTQAIAEQRKYTSRAEDFFAAFSEDPAGFSRSLAVQAGLIREGDEPVRDIPSAKIPTADEIAAQIEEQVAHRIEEDPRVKQAALSQAEAQVEAEFDRLQDVHSVPLPPELRKSLMQEAVRTNNPDLEGILAKRLLMVQQRQSRASATRAASTSRPGTPPAGALDPIDTQKRPETVREAWEQAKVAAAQQ